MAKGWGMLFVILAHLGLPYHLGKWIYTFHMPLFFFLSGYVFSEKYSFKKFFQKKVKCLLIPYFCLGFVMTIFFVLRTYPLSQDIITPFLNILKNVLVQKRWWTLWFLACLFFLNIFYYLLSKLFKNRSGYLHVTVVILTLVGLLYYHFGGEPLFWNVDVCLTALPFFHIGYCCRKKQFLDKYIFSRNPIYLGAIFLFLNVFTGLLNYKLTGGVGTLEMYRSVYGIVPLTYISAFSGLFVIIIFSYRFTNKAIQYIGSNTLLYYAWHQTIMMPLVDDFYKKIGIFQTGPLSSELNMVRILLSLFLICFVLTILNLMIQKTRLRFIIGK